MFTYNLIVPLFDETNSSYDRNLALVSLYSIFNSQLSQWQLKRIILTIETKYKIIKELENGENATKLTRIHVVGISTITDIKKIEK